jgi:uncharacterized membrane protein YkoI
MNSAIIEKQIMKITLKITCLLAAALMAGCESESEEGHEHEHENRQARLQAQARVSEADARATAQAKVPDGTIKEAELEKEKGKLIWSFDIARPDTHDITEVNIDAINGQIVAVDVETPKDQAKENDGDKSEKKDKD